MTDPTVRGELNKFITKTLDYSMLLSAGVIRIALDVPKRSIFNHCYRRPHNCPTDSLAKPFFYRRPLRQAIFVSSRASLGWPRTTARSIFT